MQQINKPIVVTFYVHSEENNPESQKHLEENEVHFSKQCQRLFDYLMDTQIVSVKDALINLHISSLPRRIKDLKQNGVLITDFWQHTPDSKYKVWSMTREQINYNKKFAK